MPFTDAQRQKIAAWLSNKQIKQCPVCGASDLEVYDHTYVLTPVSQHCAEGDPIEQVVLQCSRCATTISLNAERMGLRRDAVTCSDELQL